MDNNPPYSQVESSSFQTQVSDIIGSFPRWDEIVWAYDRYLVYHPYWAEEVPGTPLRVLSIKTDQPLHLYFRIDEDRKQIHLLHLAISR